MEALRIVTSSDEERASDLHTYSPKGNQFGSDGLDQRLELLVKQATSRSS